MLTDNQKKYLIELIENNQTIPEDFKNILFPTTHEEYELAYAGKMRKEDLLANQDGTFPIPLQIEKIFNGENYATHEDDWRNMIVYGDNLQFLKTIYENKDPIIKDKIKGKVKLIYIDPPFATQREFRSQDEARAYSDKKDGAEFLEFLRRRLIVAREILAEDGTIFVHMDQKMGHHVKLVMDEVFGKNNFRNEIIWCYKSGGASQQYFSRKHDNIFFYSKTGNYLFYPQKEKSYMLPWSGENPAQTYYEDERGRYTLVNTRDYWNDIGMIATSSYERIGYPTQKPEILIERIIRATTNEGDLVLDFFGGSGTTMSVSEKLNRRWITCDLGKLSFFTMQKRLLQIADSKSLSSEESYDKKAKTFMTASLGVYDLEKTLKLDWEKYKDFVAQLFEIDNKDLIINGVKFDGIKRNFPVKIFNYEKHIDSGIDDSYLRNLLLSMGSKAPSRIYIVSPATRVNYIADYEEIDSTKFYFLKVPYEMIRELHSTPFMKLRQPRSKNNINEIEEMKGFQFNYNPEISCKLVDKDEYVEMILDKFSSYSIQQGDSEEFTTLSSIFVNYNYNGESFIMDDVKFWDEISTNGDANKEIRFVTENDQIKAIVWRFEKGILGNNPMFVFSDIFGNDVVIKLELGE